jgi:rhodanese-related sulfurtransferase
MKSRKSAMIGALSAVALASAVLAGNCGEGKGCAPAPCGKGCGKPCCAAPAKAPEGVVKDAEIGIEALAVLIRSGATVVVLDARSGKYDDGRRLPGARSLAPSATAEEAAKLLPSKDALAVTYCTGVKCPASSALAKQLRTLGYSNVLEFREGIEGWAAAGHQVLQPAAKE